MAARSHWWVGLIAGLAAVAGTHCTLDQEGTGELLGAPGGSAVGGDGGSGGEDDASAGGMGATGGTGGTGATGGLGGGSGGAAGASGTGGSGGTSGSGGLDAGGSGGVDSGGTGGTGAGGAGGTAVDATDHELDCLDGLDDDLDTAIDCADSDCTALYECVPTAPPGWQGFYRVRELPWAEPPPPIEPCPDGSTPVRHYKDAAGPIACSCSCGGLTGATCNPAPIGCAVGRTDCQSPSDWTGTLADGSCHKPSLSGASSLSCTLTGPPTPAVSGACPPQQARSGEQPFTTIVDVCVSPSSGGGCMAGSVCAPRGGGSYTGKACVSLPANDQCPVGWSARSFAYGAYVDDRDCNACACAPQVTCTGTSYAFYDYNDCNNHYATISDNTCKNLSGALDYSWWSIRLSAGPTASGTCTTSGGEPTGAVTTQAPSTFCCQQ